MAKYVLDVYRSDVPNETFERIDIVSTFEDLSYVKALNGVGLASFGLSVNDRKANRKNLRRWANRIAIKRDGEVEWFGPITDIDAETATVGGNINVQCQSYFAHLFAKLTDKLTAYSGNEDINQVAWNLINLAQSRTNGTLAINQGSMPASVPWNDTFERAIIGSEIQVLANLLNGFDFTLDPVVVDSLVTSVNFNTYYPYKGIVKTDIPKLTYGRGGNVASYSLITTSGLYNSAISEGSGTGDVISSELNYGSAQIANTRREVFVAEKNISLSSSLSTKLQAYLNRESVEQLMVEVQLYPSLRPLYSEFDLGDILTLDLSIEDSGGYMDIKRQGRVKEIAIDVDAQGAETIQPKLEVFL